MPKIGYKLTEEHKNKISKSLKGKSFTEEHKNNLSGENNGRWGKGHLTEGPRNGMWKEDGISYSGIHMWIRGKLGSAKECANCDRDCSKKFEWSNLSGEYRRDLDDWVNLCQSCHRLIDGVGHKRSEI